MGSDPNAYGVSFWPLPSPTATPESFKTLPAKQKNQTPRLQEPISLAEPFRTPRTESSNAALTPQSATSEFSFTQFPVNKLSLSPHDPQFHINHKASSTLPLPPVVPSKRLSSSPHLDQKSAQKENIPIKMNGFPLQTPPRNPEEYPHHMQPSHTTPLSAHPGSQSTPIRQAAPEFQTPTFQTPYQHPAWQLSPDGYHYPQPPASAPVAPHGRFFWNQSPLMNHGFDGGMGGSQMSQPHSIPEIPHWPATHPQNMSFQGNIPQSSPGVPNSQDGGFWGPSSSASFAHDSPLSQTTTSVNPSLIFSFASPPNTSPLQGRGPQAPQQEVDGGLRQPYEQQTRESHREKEMAKKLKQQQQNNRVMDRSRPPLQRSNTDGGGFRKSKNLTVERSGQNSDHIPRKPSPLKRLSQASLSSIAERRRSSRHRTRLVVDDTGTARTEIYNDDDAKSSRRSFSMWGDDDSSDDDRIINSARNSFALPADYPRPITKLQRGEGEHDGFDLERPPSSTSLSSISSNRQSGLFRRSISLNIKNRLSQASFSDFEGLDHLNESSQETIMGEEEGCGDAQDALKKLVGGRLRRDQSDPNATIKAARRAATNPFPNTSMIDITKFPSPPSPTHSPFSFAKPTTSSSTNTPLTERSGQSSSDSTQCVCGVSEDLPWPLLQCESCAKFSHVRCIFGQYAEEGTTELPRMFICGFCTGHLRQPPALFNNGMPTHDFYAGGNYGISPLSTKGGAAGGPFI